MSIYRGAGGAGDATADSSSEALLIRQLVVEVQADADAASASATAAAGSSATASTQATNAATNATNAANSASSASTSETNAASFATAAQTAETNAETAETNAETAETNAAASASAASTSASNATTSATNASNSASSASTSATNASNSASAAATSATNASNSASAASTSATNAANSATLAASYTPSQTGNSGKFLTTDGTNTSWGTVTGGSGTVTSVAALTLGTTGTDLSSPVANGTTTPVITLQVPTASATNRGALSAADWTTFNNKGSGTVTSVSVASANGFTGTSSGGATPALTVATSITGILKGNGTAISASTAGTDYVAPGTATTFTALQTFAGTSSNADLKTSNILEAITVSATAATGTIQYDVTTQSVLYYTTNATGNFTVNFRGSSGTSLNTIMATGESLSATFLVTNGATPYYNSVVTIDGNSVTPKWQGTAPTAGNASSIDSYTYVIIKTGSAAFTVLATQTKFA